MLRQALVDERVVGVEELDDTAVFCNDRPEQHLGFALHRLPQVAVEIRRIGPDVLQLAQEEPLAGEAADERVSLRVGEHAPDLPFEDRRVAQRAARRYLEQLLVRNTAPEEEG